MYISYFVLHALARKELSLFHILRSLIGYIFGFHITDVILVTLPTLFAALLVGDF